MTNNNLFRAIQLFALVVSVLQLSCTGELAPPRRPIMDVSTPTRDEAWIVTRERKLFRLSASNVVEEEKSFQGNAKLVYFIDQSTGWVVDSDGRVWNTIDGATWQAKGIVGNANAALHASNLAFANEQVGWMTTSFGLWLTSDAGANWKEIPIRVVDSQPVDFFPIDPETGWLLLTNGKILKTTDRGTNWELIDLHGDFTIRAFYSDGKANTWAAAADGRPLGLFRMNSLGEWEQVLRENQRRDIGIRSISFPVPQYGWLCGLRSAKLDPDRPASGIIMKTEDGGTNWTAVPTSLPDEQFIHIKFFDRNNGWLASADAVYHTNDGGDSWIKVWAF